MRSLVICYLVLCLAALTTADTDLDSFFTQLRADYENISPPLVGAKVEVASISDFTYTKDRATFTFRDGNIYLCRYIDGRPTTAIFVGDGHVRIDVPVAVERAALKALTGDTLVDEDFEVCFIRMADNLDRELKDILAFDLKTIGRSDFKRIQAARPEEYFQPSLFRPEDNHWYLVRSAYERAADGYFWARFNRYVYIFNPNAPEQVSICRELEEGDMAVVTAATYQREERNCNSTAVISKLEYPTVPFEQRSAFEFSDVDGRMIKTGVSTLALTVNTDSLRFVEVKLDRKLRLDSVLFSEGKAGFVRRKDMPTVGIVLEHYVSLEQDIELTFFYSGRDFSYLFPVVANPIALQHDVEVVTSPSYSVFIDGDLVALDTVDGIIKRRYTSVRKTRWSPFFVVATGLDTAMQTAVDGTRINSVARGSSSWYIDRADYMKGAIETYDYLCTYLGNPYPIPDIYLLNYAWSWSTPSVFGLADWYGKAENGGFDYVCGIALAKRWLSDAAQLATVREEWLRVAWPQFLGMLYTEQRRSPAEYYYTLYERREALHTLLDDDKDLPLACGRGSLRVTDAVRGVWLLHMLRWMFYDFATDSEESFRSFLRDVVKYANLTPFSNHDFTRLAEIHFGAPLDWFFNEWLYGCAFPHFDVTYDINQADDGWFVSCDVGTENVGNDFMMPVVLRIDAGSGFFYARKVIRAGGTSFELGPFEQQPSSFKFNEFGSVLGTYEVTSRP